MSTSTIPWGKRSYEIESPIQSKKTRYFFRLESESSAASTDDTESVYSIQDKETDIVKDTSDTGSDSSEYDLDVHIEYDIDSQSDDDRDMIIFDSSGESEADIILAAAVVGDSSLETFITDAEDSDNSRQGDSATGLTDFWICIQCKSQNDNPQFRFCDKCFQDRKAIFPPRPRRRKKADRSKEAPHAPVKLDALKSCLNGLSQDSGIGSSQEFASLCLDQIVVPSSQLPSTSVAEDKSRKRQISESSLSDEYEPQRPPKLAKKEEKENMEESKKEEEKCDTKSVNGETRTKDGEVKGPLPELKEDCIICNVKPKNSVFLHGRIAHMCCCYGCAMRTWKSLKRCPMCRRKVSNVVRVFTT